MRPRRQHFGKSQMTKAYNRSAYQFWLHTAPIEVVTAANPNSIGATHGVPADQVARDIASEPERRVRAMADFVGGGM